MEEQCVGPLLGSGEFQFGNASKWRGSLASLLKNCAGSHADSGEPSVDELRPSGYGELGAAQAKGVAAFGTEMHLRGNASVRRGHQK